MSVEIPKYSPIVVSVLLVGASVWMGLTAFPHFEDGLRFMVRETAYASTTFYLLAYYARPLLNLTASDVARALVRTRRQIGLAAALAHTVHFGAVVSWLRFTGERVDIITVVFGGLGFVAFWLMAATSNDISVKWLGAHWKRLHRYCLHYIWIIFMQTYLGDAFDQPWYWVFVALLAVGLAMRIKIFMSLRPTAAVI